jgi:hypothetical protein
MELESKLAKRHVSPSGELGHYSVGEQALFQKAQQLVVEEA